MASGFPPADVWRTLVDNRKLFGGYPGDNWQAGANWKAGILEGDGNRTGLGIDGNSGSGVLLLSVNI